MKHKVPHDLGRDTAKKVAEAALKSYTEKFAQYQPRATWVSDNRADITFRAKGLTLSGTVELQERSIDLDLEVPLLLRPLKGRALDIIEREINTWIGKAKAGEI